MHQLQGYLMSSMWIAWAAYWVAASRNVKSTVRRESLPSRLAHLVPLAVAVFLIWTPHVAWPVLEMRFLPASPWLLPVGALLTLAGLLFTVWARVHLGRNWSGTVTLKQGHELVTSGPYALVRHPIYTGLLLAFAGSALVRGEWRGILALALVYGSFWFKLRHEEAWMREQFGAVYQAYSERVPALLPFTRRTARSSSWR